jgi:hypothetical protein
MNKENIIEEFDKFVKNWCGNMAGHLLDDDDNDGERFRDLIREQNITDLSKDDLYEIEKILDNYSAEIIKCQKDLCDHSIRWDYIGKTENPMKDKIEAYQKSYEKIKSIRDKLERMRLKT